MSDGSTTKVVSAHMPAPLVYKSN